MGRQGSDCIQRRAKNGKAIASNGTIGRLDPRDSAIGRRDADRSHCVSTQCQIHKARSDGGGRPTRRSASNIVGFALVSLP
jgi:hypothetical protein